MEASKKLGGSCAAALVLLACTGPREGNHAHHVPSPITTTPASRPLSTAPEAPDVGARPEQAEAPPEPMVQATLADSINLFARDLHRELAKQPGNLFYSPLSISLALTMTAAGARGQTAEQMTKALHLGAEPQAAPREDGKLTASLSSEPKAGAPELRLANRLWVDKTAELVPAFAALTLEHYRAPVEKVDFIHSPEPSRVTLNRWVEQQTKERIKVLIPRGGIDPDTRVVLINAIYFKGLWTTPFKKSETRREPFYDDGKTARKVAMMHAVLPARYAETAEAQVLELPYSRGGGSELAMVVVLPKDPKGLPAVERRYALEGLAAFVRGLAKAHVRTTVPRFSATVSFRLSDVLRRLGMPLAFTDRADFSAMATDPFWIGEVYHKAFVKLDEAGTEAAAATAVAMRTSSATSVPLRDLKADHPFLFAIRDVKSGAILFGGRITTTRGE